MPSMAFDFGLGDPSTCHKQKFRWLFKIQDVSAQGTNALPPYKSQRPNLSYKEMDIQHLTETIYRPSKPEWKTVTLTLFDSKANQSPVWTWITSFYDPQAGTVDAPVGGKFIVNDATMELYGGSGTVLETWTWENVWCQEANFGELDMSASEYVYVDLTLRYDRAYFQD